MKNALPDSKYIFDQLMNGEQKEKIGIFLNELSKSKDKYETDILWLMDQKIGGVGGYCMPADPKKNPFPVGLDRELFRPLQYARSEIDIVDIRVHSRFVVQYSGMHLEVVLRLFLKRTKVLGEWRFYNSTLGKATHEISKMDIIDKKIIDVLFHFIPLYNKAKHEMNTFKGRPRLFAPSDAIISYFGARIVGQMILEKLQYSRSNNIYEINNESFNF